MWAIFCFVVLVWMVSALFAILPDPLQLILVLIAGYWLFRLTLHLVRIAVRGLAELFMLGLTVLSIKIDKIIR